MLHHLSMFAHWMWQLARMFGHWLGSPDNWKANIPTWATTIFTGLYLIVTYRIFRSTNRYNEASTRPFVAVSISDLTVSSDGPNWGAYVEFENIGRLPATNVEMSAYAEYFPKRLREPASQSGPHDVFPAQRYGLYVTVPGDEMHSLDNGDVVLTITARADYLGVTRKEHFTEQRMQFDPKVRAFNVSGTHA